ncbi:DUF7379 domain-containing protein [Caballeronia humi]|uniref:CHAT domain protein n=1 Tax=Caballeronia humi TaxID=326474 RepID=A0A158JDZ7_9BURK|nr:CHAT domain-containing protein [Caballeronia humi]SAL66723.1 CHAT domain protein [Caballeronia humi]
MPEPTPHVTFVVPSDDSVGSPAPAQPNDLPLPGTSRDFVRLATTRGAGNDRKVSATLGLDVVIIRVQDGPALVLHPETARELLLGQQEIDRCTRDGAPPAPAPAEVRVPMRLQWRGLQRAGFMQPTQQRGMVKDVLCASIQIFRPQNLFDIKGVIAGAIAQKVISHFDERVKPGLYRLSATGLGALSAATAVSRVTLAAGVSQPVLVLLHGTFSDASGTFGKLWAEHADLIKRIFERYGNGVYALEHPTLGVSPIANARALIETMPKGTRLHLLSHSRGGLIAEVLARACSGINLSETDLEPFTKFGGTRDLDDLKALIRYARSNDIRVERVVRVACPARGTLLASRRLDAYLSVVRWLLELAQIPVAPALMELLADVARCRMDPAEAPGLAAQMPDSPLIQWLHEIGTPLPGVLRVVAGDMEGGSVGSWIQTLLSDAFFWTDNDLVVQTRSMYGGAPRATDASFVLDRGDKVSHFAYFANARTAKLIADALITDAPPADFRPIGPLSWAGESSEGTRGPGRRRGESQPDKPAVFLLPGILGSHLKVNGQRVWLSWRLVNGLDRLHFSEPQPDGVTPDEPIGMTYDDLTDFLGETHEVIEFAFDWRKPMEDEAQRLADAVQQTLTQRMHSAQPVRIIAHSMGGLLARAMQLERPDVWDRMLAHPKSRFLMLGTPNGGSWAPMQVLTGDDTFGNALVTLGSPFRDHAARQMMAELPGFLQLQAGLSADGATLARAETWRALADADAAALSQYNWWHTSPEQVAVFKWGIPTQSILDRALAWSKRLDAQREKMPGIFRGKAVMVVGRATLTPCGYEQGEQGLTYLHVEEDAGDGRVTLQSATLPDVPMWRVPVAHGDLPKAKDAFAAFLDLLETGTTKRLLPAEASTKGSRGAAVVGVAVNGEMKRWRPSRAPGAITPPRGTDDLQRVGGAEDATSDTPAVSALKITVLNGNLKFTHDPLMLGHYRGFALSGTERVVDPQIGDTMSASLRLGRYPQTLESQLIFINRTASLVNERQLPRPAGVVVIGLGNEGELRTSDAIASVRQGVIAWSQRLLETESSRFGPFRFSAVLAGSGGINVTAGAAARYIAEGVSQANERLASMKWPQVERLTIVELFLDRATEAYRSLQLLNEAMPGRFAIDDCVQHGTGALRRPLESSYRGADYDLISAVSRVTAEGEREIAFTLDTRRARTEVRCVGTQPRLLRELVSAASNDQSRDVDIRSTLFQLVVPLEIRPFLAGSTEMLIQVDDGTAGIPWELLDTTPSDSSQLADGRPWAIRSKLIRKLRMTDDRRFVADADSTAQVLVIGEPDCDTMRYARLPGARSEAVAVAQLVKDRLGEDDVSSLIGDENGIVRPSARAVITALMKRDWRIVHIAGHGEAPDSSDTPPSGKDEDRLKGVVLSNGTYLGPREIRNMERVPELVFVNCCHLAERDTRQLLADEMHRPVDRPQFAANVAQALIGIGVRCVIAAGWAVDDEPAKIFATTFYEAVLKGERFGDAVGLAREAAWKKGGNTWAAYQCYGDANWRLNCKLAKEEKKPRALEDYYANVASAPALTLALEALIVKLRYDDDDDLQMNKDLGRLRYLESRFGEKWQSMGAVAEAFGMAWAEAGLDEQAVAWYDKAVKANDGSAALKAAEQYANLSVKCAWATLRDLADNGNLPAAERSAAIAKALARVDDAIARIEALIRLNPTMERYNILASAYKRRAMIERFAGRTVQERDALKDMSKYYAKALDQARLTNNSNSFYPALNCLATELVMRPAGALQALDEALASNIASWLKTKNEQDPDFWSVYAESELSLYRSVANGSLATDLLELETELKRLQDRVPSPKYWRSVSGQCEFVLERYRVFANETERAASDKLRNLVSTWAGEKCKP